MPSLLDVMIMRSVKCLTCGAGYGKCDCAEKSRAERDRKNSEIIEADYQRMMKLSDEELIAECKALGINVEPKM